METVKNRLICLANQFMNSYFKSVTEMNIQIHRMLKNFSSNLFSLSLKRSLEKNFRIIRVDYHDDEYSEDKNGNYTIKSPAHVHVAFVPVIQKDPEQLKGKGVLKLRLQHSLSQACEADPQKSDG